MTAADYAFSRPIVAAQVRGIGREQGVPERAYDMIESFVAALPAVSVDSVVQAFALRVSAQIAA
jgi:hypothetical protein